MCIVHCANLRVFFKLRFEYTLLYVCFVLFKNNIVSGAGVYRFCSLNVAARIWPQRVAYSIIQVQVPYNISNCICERVKLVFSV
jgi:hypothetical protein